MRVILDDQKFDLSLLKRKKPNKYVVDKKKLNESIKKNQELIKRINTDLYCKKMLAMS